MALPTTTSSGGQTATGSPQTATGTASNPGGGGIQSNSLQPGTASDLLKGSNGNNGIPLSNTPVTTVNLKPGSSASTSVASNVSVPPKHHVNVFFLGLALILVVMAFALFAAIGIKEKNTTNYKY